MRPLLIARPSISVWSGLGGSPSLSSSFTQPATSREGAAPSSARSSFTALRCLWLHISEGILERSFYIETDVFHRCSYQSGLKFCVIQSMHSFAIKLNCTGQPISFHARDGCSTVIPSTWTKSSFRSIGRCDPVHWRQWFIGPHDLVTLVKSCIEDGKAAYSCHEYVPTTSAT